MLSTANPSLMGGGVDGAMHRAGGPAILNVSKLCQGRLPAGKTIITQEEISKQNGLYIKCLCHQVRDNVFYKTRAYGSYKLLIVNSVIHSSCITLYELTWLMI